MSSFRFKQFTVEHSASTMKVGTDAVLLGAWCRVLGAGRVLDVGTGCGVIALMVAQRAPMAIVDAIDIDADSVAEAQRNFNASLWSDRLHAVAADYNKWVGEYDLMVSNPPFFVDALLPPDEVRAQARHAQSLTYEQLFARARSLLTPDGRLAFVTPVEVRSMVIEQAAFHAMHLARQCEVTPVEGKGVKRLLWEFSASPASLCREALVIADAHGCYTGAYRDLCRDFYLKF